jgi:hypothetical protein
MFSDSLTRFGLDGPATHGVSSRKSWVNPRAGRTWPHCTSCYRLKKAYWGSAIGQNFRNFVALSRHC